MAQRVVLAYSGGLDTSVAVKWIQEEWGAEVVALAVDVGQEPHADAAYWETIRERRSRGRRDRGAGRGRPRGVRGPVRRQRDQGQRPLRGQVPAGVVPVTSRDRAAPRRRGTGVRRRRGGPRLHREGQRPGALRGRAANPRAGPRGPRPGADVGVLASRLDRVRRALRHPDHGVGGRSRTPSTRTSSGGRSSAARWRTRGTRRPTTSTSGRVTSPTPRPSPARSSSGSSVGSRWPSTASPPRCTRCCPSSTASWARTASAAIDMVENRRVGIKSREVYECPGALALLLAHADLESITLERDVMREKSRLETRWAETVYDGLWYSPLREAFDAFVDSTQRHVTGEVRLRLQPGQCTVVGRRAERGPLRLRPRDLRGRRRVPSRGRGGIRAPLGALGRDVVEAPAGGGARGQAPRRERGRAEHALARAVRRGSGRRAHGAVGEPLVRSPARGRRRRGLARARRDARRGRSDDRGRGRDGRRRARRGGVGARDRRLRVRAHRRGHPHRGRASRHRARRGRRRQAAHRSQPQRPGRDRSAALDEAHRPRARRRDRRPAARARHQGGGGRDRARRARVHASAARAAGAARAPPARPRVGARSRRRAVPAGDRRRPTSRPSAPARSPDRASRSTRTAPHARSGSGRGSRTRSTRSRTATSSPKPSSPPRSRRCTSRVSARRSCSGRRASSASCACPTRSRPGRR